VGKYYTTKDFIEKAQIKHNGLYQYTKTRYSNSLTKVKILCKHHGVFEQAPGNHLRGEGCPRCDKANTLDTKSFIAKARLKHGTTYIYTSVEYKHSQSPVHIKCREHGLFEQKPVLHLFGSGCPKCANRKRSLGASYLRSSKSEFVRKAVDKYGDKFKYLKTKYSGCRKSVRIECPAHGIFEATPLQHMQGAGCPKCTRELVWSAWSNSAVDWIEREAYSRKMRNVRHALTGGEYRIPGTRYRVDGFHKSSNTIFEFHGTRWHGDPVVFKPNTRPNPYSNRTAKQLYIRTLKREDLFKSLGYRVIVIWEKDYLAGKRYSYIL